MSTVFGKPGIGIEQLAATQERVRVGAQQRERSRAEVDDPAGAVGHHQGQGQGGVDRAVGEAEQQEDNVLIHWGSLP